MQHEHKSWSTVRLRPKFTVHGRWLAHRSDLKSCLVVYFIPHFYALLLCLQINTKEPEATFATTAGTCVTYRPPHSPWKLSCKTWFTVQYKGSWALTNFHWKETTKISTYTTTTTTTNPHPHLKIQINTKSYDSLNYSEFLHTETTSQPELQIQCASFNNWTRAILLPIVIHSLLR